MNLLDKNGDTYDFATKDIVIIQNDTYFSRGAFCSGDAVYHCRDLSGWRCH